MTENQKICANKPWCSSRCRKKEKKQNPNEKNLNKISIKLLNLGSEHKVTPSANQDQVLPWCQLFQNKSSNTCYLSQNCSDFLLCGGLISPSSRCVTNDSDTRPPDWTQGCRSTSWPLPTGTHSSFPLFLSLFPRVRLLTLIPNCCCHFCLAAVSDSSTGGAP